MRLSIASASLAIIMSASNVVWAAGFEKSIMWGGRTAGLAGISVPQTTGSEALYFNPAGMVTTAGAQDLSFNISPVRSQFKGPVVTDNVSETSRTNTSAPVSLIYAGNINDRLAIGMGGYVSAGTQATYDTQVGANPAQVRTDLVVTEIAVGGAYKVSDSLKVGLAYRVTQAQASFSTLTNSNAVNLAVNDLSGNNYEGFKLGAQYTLSENTTLGLTYRSEVEIKAKDGKFGGRFFTASQNIDNTPAEATTFLPQALTLGASHKLNEQWKMFGELAWTQYSRIKSLTFVGPVTRNGGSALANSPMIDVKWKDQFNLRLAGEYMGYGMPIRFGYGYTSQVTNAGFARATFVPPGAAHTLTVGTGHTFANIDINGGLEYTMASASGTAESTAIRTGKFEVSSYALHLGAIYNF